MDLDIEQLKYPIGTFKAPEVIDATQLKRYINDIRHLPKLIEINVQTLDAAQLATPYRPGGWTVHQLVHHVADSHTNALTRFKWALTEENPIIKTYEESKWAELWDVQKTPINVSLTLLHALHIRWVNLMDNMTEQEWNRTYRRPDSERAFPLKEIAGMYSWHGRHHLAHIERLKERNNW